MTCKVEVEPSAHLQLLQLDDWWSANRPASATRVVDAFERAIELLAETPDIGALYAVPDLSDVRRLRLAGTPYSLYYQHDASRDVVSVLAVWSGMRGHGPISSPRK